MRFYETDKEFVLLQDSEEAPNNAKLYTYGMNHHKSEISLPQFDLVIGYYLSEFPARYISYLVYKNISFKLHDEMSHQKMIEFLNDLKHGDHEKKLEQMVFESFKSYPEYAYNSARRVVEQLQSENNKMKERLEKINALSSIPE
ncbi:MAG TPA: hypothetical protein PKZ75_06850 [Bacteroidia bacterium]|nr:hypothetical protein [Bacteroidia bacterium]